MWQAALVGGHGHGKNKTRVASFIAHRFNRTLRTLKAHSFGQWNLDSHQRSHIKITLDRGIPRDVARRIITECEG